MRPFELYTAETAAPDIRDVLRARQETFGFLPNIVATVASSSEASQAFFSADLHYARCSLSTAERETVALVTSLENNSGYCIAGHSALAYQQGVIPAAVSALRLGQTIQDIKLQTLADFTRSVIRNRGHVSQSDLIEIFDVGFNPAQVIEVIFGISLKMFTNMVSNATALPLDPEFLPFSWLEKPTDQIPNNHSMHQKRDNHDKYTHD